MADVARRPDTLQPTKVIVGVIAMVVTVVVLGLAWFAVAGAGTLEVPTSTRSPRSWGTCCWRPP